MELNSLGISSEEQTLTLIDGSTIEIRFDPFYYRWYADYYKEGSLLAAGIALDPDTDGMLHILDVSCAIVDAGDKKEDYEPYEQLGDRLAVIEVDER